jgi:hypothetical protein
MYEFSGKPVVLITPGHNWIGGNLGLTIIDSLDTMLIMGLDDLYKESREWINDNLDFDKVNMTHEHRFTFLGDFGFGVRDYDQVPWGLVDRL